MPPLHIHCSECGNRMKETDKFCTKCGTKINTKPQSELQQEEEEEDKEGTRSRQQSILNYGAFKKQSDLKRQSYHRQKKPNESKHRTNGKALEKEVKINVGIINEDKKGNLVKQRGSKIPVVVNRTDSSNDVLVKALKN